MGLACATTAPPLTPQRLDWAAVNERWSVQIVTTDPDGEVRVSRAWIAIVDGHGAMRTGGTRWLENLRRDPHACLWFQGAAHPLRVDVVEGDEHVDRYAAALRDKYGWQLSWLTAVRPRSDRDAFLRLVPGADGTPCPMTGGERGEER